MHNSFGYLARAPQKFIIIDMTNLQVIQYSHIWNRPYSKVQKCTLLQSINGASPNNCSWSSKSAHSPSENSNPYSPHCRWMLHLFVPLCPSYKALYHVSGNFVTRPQFAYVAHSVQ